MSANHVDTIKSKEKFGLLVVYPENEDQSFKYYHKVAVSKKGLLMGYWGIDNYKYRDHLGYIPMHAKLIRKTDNYLFFKI